MKVKIYILTMLAVALLLSGCSNSGFKVTLELKGLGEQNVRVAYCGDQGLTDNWVKAQKDVVTIEGSCNGPSLMLIFNSMNVPIVRLVVDGGDNIEVKGSITDSQLKITGSKIMEEWNAFEAKHKNEYGMANSQALNTAIEAYVKQNPKSIVSTLLVLTDYAPSSSDKVDALLDAIDDGAKPESLMASYDLVNARYKKGVDQLSDINMIEMTSDDFKVARFTGSKPSVVFFWDKDLDNREHESVIAELKMLDTTRVNIVDINIDSDSAGWRNIVRRDSTQWKHYWVPGSMMNSQLTKLQIMTLPTIIVTDSLGKAIYRGNDAIKARQTVENK